MRIHAIKEDGIVVLNTSLDAVPEPGDLLDIAYEESVGVYIVNSRRWRFPHRATPYVELTVIVVAERNLEPRVYASVAAD